MLNKILTSETIEQIKNDTRAKNNSSVFGVTSGFFPFFVLSLTDKKSVIVVDDFLYAKKVVNEINKIEKNRAFYLPFRSEVLMYNVVNLDNEYERINTLINFTKKDNAILVLSPEALSQKYTKKEELLDKVINIKKGDEISQEKLTQKLIDSAYKRVELVDKKGEFSIRGDVVSVFPINSEMPYRIELFGDTIDSIKTYDLDSFLSVDYIDTIEIYPTCSEFKPDGVLISKIKTFMNPLNAVVEQRQNRIIASLIEKFETNTFDSSLSYLDCINDSVSIYDYFDDDVIVIYNEPKLIINKIKAIYDEHANRLSSLILSGEATKLHINQLVKQESIINTKYTSIATHSLNTQNNLFKVQKAHSIHITTPSIYTHNQMGLIKDISIWKSGGYKVYLASKDTEDNRLNEFLKENEVYVGENGDATILPYDIIHGFILHESKLVVIGCDELYVKRLSKKQISKEKKLFALPEVGDYVVHENYGIGRFLGITKLRGYAEKDFLEIEYGEGDKLYVPIEQTDLLTSYTSTTEKPKLNRIGNQEFERILTKTYKSIREMAINLLELYTERDNSVGYRFEKHNTLDDEFASSFEFEETVDQARSINEVFKDMASDKVMDRLLCADVGFGKTEVAFRAMYKAVQSGKQVAFLAPTTVLCDQHYRTAIERFKNYGVRIDFLSRFKTKSEQNQTIKDILTHNVDIVFGTHRLLSKDIVFADLGLLVLDEEQRFGVEAKETIKNLKKNVDVLSLSATPIPRTLNMSLTGIRDISTIETPPEFRLPISTMICEYSDDLLIDVVNRELNRNGQVFIIYNKVVTIDNFAKHVKSMLPNAKITIAHGQMKENELEENIYEFYSGKSNVLIASTIIENGIDLPNANTMIVLESDNFGLSQLYQLRGRVGRSDRQAYAYFTYMPDKVLTEVAYNRLLALSENTELGSGFKIALRDLEMRGAGNILGKEQSGHMDKVGYEMYCKLLAKATEELKETGEISDYTFDNVNIEIELDCYVPESYALTDKERIRLYSKIASIESKEEMEEIYKEFSDIYGDVPKEIENMCNVAIIKNLANKIHADSIVINKVEGYISFPSIIKMNKPELLEALSMHIDDLKINAQDKKPKIETNKKISIDNKVDKIVEFLLHVASI